MKLLPRLFLIFMMLGFINACSDRKYKNQESELQENATKSDLAQTK